MKKIGHAFPQTVPNKQKKRQFKKEKKEKRKQNHY